MSPALETLCVNQSLEFRLSFTEVQILTSWAVLLLVQTHLCPLQVIVNSVYAVPPGSRRAMMEKLARDNSFAAYELDVPQMQGQLSVGNIMHVGTRAVSYIDLKAVSA